MLNFLLFICSFFYVHSSLTYNSHFINIYSLLIKALVTYDEVNVRQFGAKGDGLVDDTDAIQNAIDFAKINGKSTVVFPGGRYLISKKTIIVKKGIFLKGIDKVPAKSGFGADLCQFNITLGEGSINVPAFIIESFSGMTGFSFFYPKQISSNNIPISYGWTITTNGDTNQDGITLRNLMMTNPFLGIRLDNGGQHNLDNIYGQPIKTGICINRQYDVLRINNVHFWPFFSPPGQPLFNWILNNGDAIFVNRTDGLQGTNWFAYGYNIGLHLDNQGDGLPWLTLNNILFDVCKSPIIIDAVAYLTLNNVTLTGNNVADSQTGILITDRVKDINSIIQINGFTAVNFINSLVNRGICTVSVSMKSKIYNGKNNGVRWFDIINENDSSLLNANIPLQPGDEYRRISGKIQINGSFTYQKLVNITPKDFNAVSQWQNAEEHVGKISDGFRFPLGGGLNVISYRLPNNFQTTPNIYVLEMTLNVHTATGALGTALFYVRLRDYSKGIDYCIFPQISDPYFLNSTTLKLPFIVNSSNIYIDFVFGRATNTSNAYMDVTKIRIYKSIGTQEAYKELMPKHQNFN